MASKLHQEKRTDRRRNEDPILEESGYSDADEEMGYDDESSFLKSKRKQALREQGIEIKTSMLPNPKDPNLPSSEQECVMFDFLDFKQPDKYLQFEDGQKEETNAAAAPEYKDRAKIGLEITDIRYIRDIGLIASSFNGTVKFFDLFDFHQVWFTSNEKRAENEHTKECHTNITVFDISVKLGIMVTGGAEGRVILIDPYAQGVIKKVDAHPCEIM